MGTRGTVRIIQGNEACVEGAIAAGCRFFAGYPITPATEISEVMARRLPETGGVFMQMEDEIASVCSLVGAAWGGAKAMTATSGPGICLMQEAIGMAIITETPCVIVDVQRVGPASGIPTAPSQGDVYQVRFGSNGDYALIALSPSTSQEMFDLTVRAFNLAEKYRVPVMILADEMIAHIREKVYIPPVEEIKVIKRKEPTCPPDQLIPFKPDIDGVPFMPTFNKGYNVCVTTVPYNEKGVRSFSPQVCAPLNQRLIDKIEKNARDIIEVEEYYLDDAEVLVVAYGAVARSALKAVRDARARGIKAGFLKLKTLWPFPYEKLALLADRVNKILFPEMNTGYMAREVKLAAGDLCPVVSLPKLGGNCHKPAEILEAIAGGCR